MKQTKLLLLFVFLAISCKEEQTNYFKTVQSFDNNNKIIVPVLKINKKDFTKINDPYFSHSVGGSSIKEETMVMMKYDNEFLEIKFECRNNPRVNQNYYTKDNSPIFTQEVFISKGPNAQEEYLEIEINPNNALFLSKLQIVIKVIINQQWIF